MGDIADMMMNGGLCIDCGVSLKCDPDSFPIMCHDCHSQYQKKCNIPHLGEKGGGQYCEKYFLN